MNTITKDGKTYSIVRSTNNGEPTNHYFSHNNYHVIDSKGHIYQFDLRKLLHVIALGSSKVTFNVESNILLILHNVLDSYATDREKGIIMANTNLLNI